MTKNYDPNNVKEPSLIAKAASKFPSPPKKDGTPDPQNILFKKALAEAEKGGTKGIKKTGGSSSGGEKKA